MKIIVKENLKIGISISVIIVLVIIGTFPDNNWILNVGGDPSLQWVFNFLFSGSSQIGRHIVFPHGPLAFFMYPMVSNILLYQVVLSLLKALMVINFYFLSSAKKEARLIASFFLTYALSIILNFNYLILLNIILLFLNYFITWNKAYKALAFLLIGFGFYIKAYVAIISGTLAFGFIVVQFLNKKNVIQLLIDGSTIIAVLLVFWLILFGTISGFINYLIGLMQLAQDNSSAVSFYPQNNWIILFMFILMVIGLFFIKSSNKSMVFGIFILLSIFAAWKHGMAREDVYHIKGFRSYFILVLVAFNLFQREFHHKNILLSVLIVFMLQINMRVAYNYTPSAYEFIKTNNFVEFITDFDKLKKRALNKSNQNISKNKVSEEIRNTIGESTVDIYPWDYTYIPANNFHWQPRVVLHSYAAYTSWLDRQDASHFNSERSPEYILFHKFKGGINQISLNSIDGRYILNDGPQTIIEILSNYQLAHNESSYFILKKREQKLDFDKIEGEGKNMGWGIWENAPSSQKGIIRVKLNIERRFVQKLKSFFYKDEQFWIYLKLDNGMVHKYRIVPKNAQDGIWINPYLTDISRAHLVDSIMFKCSNQGIIADNFNIQWEEFRFKDNKLNGVLDSSYINDSFIFQSINTFEKYDTSSWKCDLKSLQVDGQNKKGKYYKVSPNSVSPIFKYNLDSLPKGNYQIIVDLWVKSPQYKYKNNAILVLDIKNKKYHGVPIDFQMFDKKEWNHIQTSIQYEHKDKGDIFKTFLWDLGDRNLLVDDYRISILKKDVTNPF